MELRSILMPISVSYLKELLLEWEGETSHLPDGCPSLTLLSLWKLITSQLQEGAWLQLRKWILLAEATTLTCHLQCDIPPQSHTGELGPKPRENVSRNATPRRPLSAEVGVTGPCYVNNFSNALMCPGTRCKVPWHVLKHPWNRSTVMSPYFYRCFPTKVWHLLQSAIWPTQNQVDCPAVTEYFLWLSPV